MAQAVATFTATFTQSRATLPATFATLPATLAATFAEPHTAKPPARPPHTPAGRGQHQRRTHTRRAAGPDMLQGSRKAASHGAGNKDAMQARRHGAQRTQKDGNAWIAPRTKTPCTHLKMRNRAYNRKTPAYTGNKEKPRTAYAMRGGGHFWSFDKSCRIKTGASKIISRIKGGTSFFLV